MIDDIETEVTCLVFEIITGEQTPKVSEIDIPVPVWIETNRQMLLDFLEYAEGLDNAIGLAANQVRCNGERIMKRFFVRRLGRSADFPFEMVIDPVIVKRHGSQVMELEGCLSWPGRTIIAHRNLSVTVSYWTLDGEFIENKKLNRLDSQVFQHETDHLEGVEETLYLPMTPFKRGDEKVGRNDPCPCGAVDSHGKAMKYKKCCGR